MMLLIMIAALAAVSVFVTYLLMFALTTRRDPLSVHTGDAAMRRARRTAGIYVRRDPSTGPRKPADTEAPLTPSPR